MHEDDEDRAAILRRRQRFIFLALSGLTGAAGCEEPAPTHGLPEVVREQPIEEPAPGPIEDEPVIADEELAAAEPEEPYVVDPAEVRHAEEAKRRARRARPRPCLSARPQVCLSRIPSGAVCLWKSVKTDFDDEPV